MFKCAQTLLLLGANTRFNVQCTHYYSLVAKPILNFQCTETLLFYNTYSIKNFYNYTQPMILSSFLAKFTRSASDRVFGAKAMTRYSRCLREVQHPGILLLGSISKQNKLTILLRKNPSQPTQYFRLGSSQPKI